MSDPSSCRTLSTRSAASGSQFAILTAVAVLAAELSGCAVVKGIFKAGVWVGVLAVVAVLAIVVVIVRKMSR